MTATRLSQTYAGALVARRYLVRRTQRRSRPLGLRPIWCVRMSKLDRQNIRTLESKSLSARVLGFASSHGQVLEPTDSSRKVGRSK